MACWTFQRLRALVLLHIREGRAGNSLVDGGVLSQAAKFTLNRYPGGIVRRGLNRIERRTALRIRIMVIVVTGCVSSALLCSWMKSLTSRLRRGRTNR